MPQETKIKRLDMKNSGGHIWMHRMQSVRHQSKANKLESSRDILH